MRHIRYARARVSRGEYYWFVDFSPQDVHMASRKCMETGHRFDNENFARHNYYHTDEDAKKDIEDYAGYQEFRRTYLRDLAVFRALPPEKKREYRRRMQKQLKEKGEN